MGATSKAAPVADMHPEQVKAAVRMTGVTLTELAERNGYSESAARRALRHPWPSVEAIIAKQIKKKPQEVWPSRYNPDGSPRSRASTTDRKRGRRPRHRQIEASVLTS